MTELKPVQSIYKIERLVGDGLSAHVYKATRTDRTGAHRQTVALKVLKSRTDISRLGQEFDALSRVHSSNCVRVLAWENMPQGPALVLEWIEGLTLLDLAKIIEIRDAGLLAEIRTQVQSGLRALEHCGLHHGDLHPGNILIDTEGCVKLVDFSGETEASTEIRGALPYIAADRWRGQRGSIASDLVSLELVLEDLRNGFASVPAQANQARERAFAFEKRVRSEDSARASGAKVLAQLVAEARKKRESCVARTMQISPAGLSRALFMSQMWSSALTSRCLRSAVSFAIFAIVSLSTVSAPVRADAPIEPASPTQSTLMIRSRRWLLVSVNGREVGYAPLDIDGLRPGRHRISWKSAAGSGNAFLDLAPGAKIILSEEQLKTSSFASHSVN